MRGQGTSTPAAGSDAAGTLLHLRAERATVLERFVRIASSFGAEIRQRDGEACTVAFRGATVSAARAVHAICTVRDSWPADVRAAVMHALDVDGGTAQQLVSRLSMLADTGVVLLDEATAEQASRMASVEHELDVQLPDRLAAEPMFRVGELRTSQAPRITVGRDAEIEELRRHVRTLDKRGRGAAITVIGPAGHGKSHLAEMAARLAHADKLRCARIHIRGFGAERPGTAMASLLREMLVAHDSTTLHELVGAEEVPFVLDVLQMVPDEHAVALFGTMTLKTRSERRLQAAAHAVEASVAQAPTLCIIEDLHWADADMRSLLGMLVKRMMPLLLLMTARPEGRGAVAGTREMTVGPLGLGEARTLASMRAATMRAPWMVGTAAYVNDDELERLVDVAQGSPLVIEQLAGAVELDRTKMAATIEAVVRSRLEEIEPEVRDDAVLAAALGEVFDRETVSRASGRTLAWQQLVQAGFMREEGSKARFCHALIRDAIYEAAREHERRNAHERLAQAQHADRIVHARQLGLAGSPKAAEAYLEVARGEDANARPDIALTLADEGLAHAQAWPVRAELLLLKGQLKVAIGRERQAREAFEACLAGPIDVPARCRALLGSVSALRLSGSTDAALPLLDEVEALAREHQLTEQLALAAYYRGGLLFSRGEAVACGEQHERAIILAREAGAPQTEALALSGLGDARYAEARIRSAIDAIARCIQLARTHGLGHIEVSNLFMMGALRALENQPVEGLADCLRGAELARKAGNKRAEMLSRLNTGMCLVQLGRPEEAEAAIGVAKRIAGETHAPQWAAAIAAMEARCHVLAGHLDRARELAHSALRYASANEGMPFFGGVALGALVGATRGAERREAFDKGQALLARGALSHNHFYFREDAIEAYLQEGDADTVASLIDDMEAYMAKEPVGRQRLLADRARALIAVQGGKADPKQLWRVLDEVRKVGLSPLAPALERALARLA